MLSCSHRTERPPVRPAYRFPEQRRSRAAAWLAMGLLLATFGALVASAQVARADDRIHVGPNVFVSVANASRSHYETLIGADPTNPNLLLGCAIIETIHPSPQLYNTVAYRSGD